MAKTVSVLSRARVVCESCSVADTAWTRFRGLMGRGELAPGEGLLLQPSGSIHTCFMRFPIDVVFLSRDLEVLAIAPALRPWRGRGKRGARAVLELAGGECERRGLEVGDRLTVEEPSPSVEKEGSYALC